VGGGFGRKSDVWPEEIAIGYAAIELGRPVKWIEERSENMLAAHGRGYTADVEAAVKSDGTVLALRIRMIADLGAYFLPSSGGPLGNVVQRVAGPYKIPAMEVECLGVMTNKPPTGPYRGAGGPEAAVPTERIFDAIAAELEMDPAELRRVNFVPSNAFPYDTATGLTYDSGDFQTALDRALELADYDGVRRGQRGATGGTLRGIGVGTAVKASGGKAGVRRSLARVEIDRVGHVDVFTDVSPHGQGTETSFSQIAGDVLGIEPSQITVHHGDTNSLATGGGTTATRGLAVGGNAVYEALQAAKATIREAASGLLRCPADQVTLAGGNALSGLDRHAAVSFAEVAEAAHRKARIAGMPEAALVFEVDYTLPANPYGFAAHVATVDIDRGTGEIRLAGYVAVHDCGPMINPMIVRGQIQGGITQGIGQALSEGVFYDEQGQPLNGSLMTYGVPNAEDTPAFVLENQETPSPTNALGIKGIGELPTVASPVAIANAVADALAQAGVSMAGVDMPLTPEKIWRALNRVG
jgi:carbon-monoxide dehydrogenase large subunit